MSCIVFVFTVMVLNWQKFPNNSVCVCTLVCACFCAFVCACLCVHVCNGCMVARWYNNDIYIYIYIYIYIHTHTHIIIKIIMYHMADECPISEGIRGYQLKFTRHYLHLLKDEPSNIYVISQSKIRWFNHHRTAGLAYLNQISKYQSTDKTIRFSS